MPINSLAAISAANSVSGDIAMSAPAAATPGAPGAGFDEMLSQLFNSGVKSLQAGEAAAIQGLEGSAPPFKVVDSIMTAQRTLQSALAVRDKAVGAFQEISRMAI
jgi:flagellar hook-basal body complex protein FliE